MSSLSVFRGVAFFEGLSFLILLGIAMPLKYIYGAPYSVEIVGPIHGMLFMVYCIYVLVIFREYQLPTRAMVEGFVAGILPFGTFAFDIRVRKQIGKLPK